MSFTVTMPQLGETVTEGTILSWLKQPGDHIAEDDALLEISTEKVDTEIPSPYAGTLLEILVAEGETVAVGTALAVIGDPGETAQAPPVEVEVAPAAPPAAAPPPVDTEVEIVAAEAPPPPPPPPAAPPVAAATGDTGVFSPVVRRLVAEHGIDVAQVTGTGRGGRVTRRDVEAFIESGGVTAAAVAADERKAGLGKGIEELLAETAAPPAGMVAPVPEESEPAPEPAPAPAAVAGVEPISRLRSRIAANMIHAKQTAAHVWTSMEVDYEAVERVRQRHREPFKEREGFSLTYLPFIARATMDALAAFPIVNSSFDQEAGTRTIHGSVDLGIAVDLDSDGLVVMTMRGADGLRMRGVAREVRRLAGKARDGKLEPDDLAGSTFTITNPGPFGSFMSAPIINLPNVAILSTDAITKRPVVVSDPDGNDAIAIHHIGYLSLTWDHRAFDGSTAVLFLRRIKDNLESWDWDQELG